MTAFSEQVIKYDTELIERWGRDIEKIQQHCLDAGLPEYTFEEYQGFQVVFRKDVYDEEVRQEAEFWIA